MPEIWNMAFEVGQTMIIRGVPNAGASAFSINIGHNVENRALHLSPRFQLRGDVKQVIWNHAHNGKWAIQEKYGDFVFEEEKPFKITIHFSKEHLLDMQKDSTRVDYPSGLYAEKYNYMSFTGDVRIKAVEIV